MNKTLARGLAVTCLVAIVAIAAVVIPNAAASAPGIPQDAVAPEEAAGLPFIEIGQEYELLFPSGRNSRFTGVAIEKGPRDWVRMRSDNGEGVMFEVWVNLAVASLVSTAEEWAKAEGR